MEDIENEAEGVNRFSLRQSEQDQFEIDDNHEYGCLGRISWYTSSIRLRIHEKWDVIKEVFSKYDQKYKCALIALFIIILLCILTIISLAVQVGTGEHLSQQNNKGIVM